MAEILGRKGHGKGQRITYVKRRQGGKMKVQEVIKFLEEHQIIPLGSLRILPTEEGWSLQSTLEEAKQKKVAAYQYMDAAQSDMSYWGRRGAYVQWEATVNILEAAALLKSGKSVV